MEAFLPVLAFLPSARAEGPLRLLTGAFCGVHLLFVKIDFIDRGDWSNWRTEPGPLATAPVPGLIRVRPGRQQAAGVQVGQPPPFFERD